MGTARKQKAPPHSRHIDAIAARLVALRDSTGLSQERFANLAGIGKTTYANWETGYARPDVDNALRLCDTYQVTLDWIYDGKLDGVPYAVASKLAQAYG